MHRSPRPAFITCLAVALIVANATALAQTSPTPPAAEPTPPAQAPEVIERAPAPSEQPVPAPSEQPVPAPSAPPEDARVAPEPESVPPATAPSVAPSQQPVEAAASPKQEAQATAEATGVATATEATEADPKVSMLASAGYPLTPGVSALPLSDSINISGYGQAQFESHSDSIDQLRQGGQPLNLDRFVLRRGRIKLTRDWEWAQIVIEIDGNTVRGPTVRLQKAEASLIYGRSHDKDQPPIAQLTLGEFDVPFGFEIPYTAKARWFMERTTGSRALWPGEPDVGARVSGGLGFARYTVAITNGEPLDEKSGFGLQDPNKNKDVTARLGAEGKTSDMFVIAGGVSVNRGKGFYPGGDATKSSIGWADRNEDGTVVPMELVGNPSQAAIPAKNFSRWAVGADLEMLLKTGLGWSMLYGELVAASNLDRGLFIADPVNAHTDLRELSYYVAFTQEITEYGIAGFRYDYYNPNSDAFDDHAGKRVPTSQSVRTYSPLVGLQLRGQARLMLEYDIIRDHLARDKRGVPTDFDNNLWTLRLQVMF